MKYLRITTTLLALSAFAGCAERAECYSRTALPHAESEGVALSLLGLNANRHSLYVRIRIDNASDHELVLPAEHSKSQWIDAVWSGYSAVGTPFVDVVSNDADVPLQVPVDGTIIVPPYSSRRFEISFHVDPKAVGQGEQGTLVLKGDLGQSAKVDLVKLVIPKPQPSTTPDTAYYGG